jgi:hypothetical protein
MSSFGVTAVRWNTELTEISDCLVHVIEKLPDGRVELTGGTSYPAQDLASIIAGGEKAWAVTANDAGTMELCSPLHVGGNGERLYTSPACTLFDLPTY